MDRETMMALFGNNGQREDVYESRLKAVQDINKFVESKRDFKEGDFIERNEFGLSKYKYPEANQACMCLNLYDDYTEDNSDTACDMIMAIAVRPKVVLAVYANSKYFKKLKK